MKSVAKKLSLLIVIAILFFAPSKGWTQNNSILPYLDQLSIRTAEKRFNKGIEEADLSAISEFYTKDAQVSFPNSNHPLKGIQAIQDSYRNRFTTLFYQIKFTPDGMGGAGKIAYSSGSYQVTFTSKNKTEDSGRPVINKTHGRFLEVFLKQQDGSWKCVQMIYNYTNQ